MQVLPTPEEVAKMSREEKISRFVEIRRFIEMNRAQLDATERELAALMLPQPEPTAAAQRPE